MGLVGGHLKTSKSIFSFFSFPFFLSFFFVFLLHKFWSSWAIEERESWVVWTLPLFFDREVRVRGFSMFLLSLYVLLACVLEREREIEIRVF